MFYYPFKESFYHVVLFFLSFLFFSFFLFFTPPPLHQVYLLQPQLSAYHDHCLLTVLRNAVENA